MDSKAFFFQGSSVLLPEGVLVTAVNLEIPQTDANGLPLLDSFTIPGDSFGGAISCVSIPPQSPVPAGWRTVPVRQIISSLADSPARLLRAFHIAQWRQESVFCGSCGCKNTDADRELARLCPSCGRMEFPRIAPAVIVLITNDEDNVLLAHNRKFLPGVYSLIAGFVEAGENLEEAAIREIREEVGIEVRNIQYIASQPWPFPNSLMVGFSARHAAGTVKPDGVEIEDAWWFTRDNCRQGDSPALPGHGSVSRYLIEKWIREQ